MIIEVSEDVIEEFVGEGGEVIDSRERLSRGRSISFKRQWRDL